MSSRDFGMPTEVSIAPPAAIATSNAALSLMLASDLALDAVFEPEHTRRVLAEELRPHVVAERHVRQLREDAVEPESGGVIARVDDLVAAAGVGEVDDVRGVVLRRKRAGRVVEVRPLEQQLHHQLGPRL